MIVVVTFVLQDQRLGPMEQEDATEPVVTADIFEQIRSRSVVPNGQAEMVIVETHVPGQIGLRPGKTENAGFTILAHLIVQKGRPAIRTINDDPREQAFGCPALRNGTGGIKNIDRGMLVASDVTERDAGNAPAGNLLQIQRAAPAAEDLDLVPSGTGQLNGLLCDEQTVFVDAGANKNPVIRCGIFQCRARAGITGRIRVIHNKGSATLGVLRGFVEPGTVFREI